MSATLRAYEWRRAASRSGWAFALLLAATLGVSIGWRILQVGEARAASATRENLTLGLVSRAAEQVASGRSGEGAWLHEDPFRSLRWRQDDYCGELADGQTPDRGCWYYLPQHEWILYRSRFGGWGDDGRGIEAYALRRVPGEATTGERAGEAFASLELQPVTASDLADWAIHTKEHK